MMKFSGGRLAHVLAEIYSDVLMGRGAVPDTWKITRLRVLFKKGDVKV